MLEGSPGTEHYKDRRLFSALRFTVLKKTLCNLKRETWCLAYKTFINHSTEAFLILCRQKFWHETLSKKFSKRTRCTCWQVSSKLQDRVRITATHFDVLAAKYWASKPLWEKNMTLVWNPESSSVCLAQWEKEETISCYCIIIKSADEIFLE